MKYSKGYKYRLEENLIISTGIIPHRAIRHQHIKLSITGVLSIQKGYSWDGASGITIDTENTMIPASIHDAFYELMRKGYISLIQRSKVDTLFYKLLLKGGMNKLRAWIWYRAVDRYALDAAKVRRKIYEVTRLCKTTVAK